MKATTFTVIFAITLSSVVMLSPLFVGEWVRHNARTEPPPSFGDPEIDAAVQFARLVGVQTGYSWGAFLRSSVEQQERQFVQAMRSLLEHRRVHKEV